MNRFVFCLVAALAGTAPVVPVMAQELAAGLAVSPVVIAPPATPLAATIKAGLSAAYYSAARDSAAYREGQDLYFFYGARHFEPIWLDEAGDGKVAFSASAQRIMRLFGDAAALGLDPADYLTPDLELASAGTDPASLAALETRFSAAVMRYATHLYTGRVDPRKVNPLLDIAPKTLDESALLMELASSDQPEAVLAALEPTHPQYLALKAALASFDDGGANRPPQLAEGPTLRSGMSDPRVPMLRTRLELPQSDSLVYDDALVEAVKSFQTAHSLDVDGAVGPATRSALNGGVPVTRADILANMERWRWMPRELGEFHVFVNIPEFRLRINRGGVEEYTTRVVVGTVKNQTPIFSDNIRHVVVNPYWNVPSSIIRGEVAPAVLRNPGYLDSQNMDLLYNGSPVSPWQVNWSMVSTSNFPFRVRQRPGPGNALGQIKFLFPNKHDVYLHDTPSKSLFSRDARAFSHGCVRVENPMEFADALMANEPNISRASLEAMFGSSERWVNPTQQIPVHLAYFTVKVTEGGELVSFGDVYGHNAALIEAMGLKKLPELAPEIVAAAEPVPAAANALSP